MAVPAVCFLIGIELSQTVQWLAGLWPQWRRMFVGLAALVVVAMVWQDLRFYFGDYTPSHRFSDQNTAIAQRRRILFVIERTRPPSLLFWSPPDGL